MALLTETEIQQQASKASGHNATIESRKFNCSDT